MLTQIIKPYLYEEYADDENIQALVDAWSTIAQQYMDWFVTVNLPIYTGPVVSGALLDWVGQGLYGIARPVLPFGEASDDGLYNALLFDELTFDDSDITSSGSFITDDDTYRRVITWHFFKGDGRQFTIPWLKRRIMQFLTGVNGIPINIDQTYDVSVMISGTIATITIPASYSFANIFQAAVDAGALELPFQFSWAVTVV